jgi:hydroxyacylglutathione hydrolase
MKTLAVDLIPAFSDNYLFALRSLNSNLVSVVDPGCDLTISSYLEKNNLKLEAIYVTHHHSDHAGGAQALKDKYGVKIYGPTSISPDLKLSEGSSFKVGTTSFRVLELPGHTLDHLAFYAEEESILFCGDVLFSLGCGRLFEGTFEQMYSSLKRLKELPDDTEIFCAHEYTLNNLNFSLSFVDQEKRSSYLKVKERVEDLRMKNIPTVPMILAFEKEYNLFLKAANVEEFKKVRLARNSF